MKIIKSLAITIVRCASAHGTVSIPTVLVGDAGNLNDSTGFGSVSYDYHIGTYEVTNSQYVAFLNSVAKTDTHGLYPENEVSIHYGSIRRTGSSGSFTYSVDALRQSEPVVWVSFWDAARFANWLTNGQPTGPQGSGTTETGVYNLGGVTNPLNGAINRDPLAWANGGWAVASENEWYKAAHFDPTKDDRGGYWLYPTRSDEPPRAAWPNDTDAYSANYGGIGSNFADVGDYSAAAGYYGTFDLAGNAYEWNDTIVLGSRRGKRGGSYASSELHLRSTFRNYFEPHRTFPTTGFRLSMSAEPIPEPAAAALILALLTTGMIIFHRRKR